MNYFCLKFVSGRNKSPKRLIKTAFATERIAQIKKSSLLGALYQQNKTQPPPPHPLFNFFLPYLSVLTAGSAASPAYRPAVPRGEAVRGRVAPLDARAAARPPPPGPDAPRCGHLPRRQPQPRRPGHRTRGGAGDARRCEGRGAGRARAAPAPPVSKERDTRKVETKEYGESGSE